MSFLERCIPELVKLYTIEPNDVIIDPCARDGSLLSLLVLLSDFVVGYDIQPKIIHTVANYDYILKVDYLTLPIPIKPFDSRIFVVGKPPDNLLKDFVEKSCKFADVIAFLFPKDFRMSEAEDMFHFDFSLKQSVKLEDGVYQIWERVV
jgi:hypothetical protein